MKENIEEKSEKKWSRTEKVLGEKSTELLKNSKVIVFGIGGVGGYVCEALARSFVGELTLVDNDVVSATNINRQIIALDSTIGQKKVEVMKQRILDINCECKVKTYDMFYLQKTCSEIDFSQYDYIVDAIDTVTAKIDLVLAAKQSKTRIISCMGTGNKLDPTAFEIADIYKTSVCPLAKVMRRELKKRGIQSLKVLYSKEKPVETVDRVPGSNAFCPSVAGLIIASEIIKELIEEKNG